MEGRVEEGASNERSRFEDDMLDVEATTSAAGNTGHYSKVIMLEARVLCWNCRGQVAESSHVS